MADSPRFDGHFTNLVVDAMGPGTPPRAREILGSLIRHVHAFAREVELTPEEWMLGVNFLNSVGQISNDRRNEMHRMSDVIGLESLVTEIQSKHVSESGETPTSSVILGPFWSPHAPWRANGDSIIQSAHTGHVTWMHGVVRDLETGAALPGVTVDIWEACSNGKYDFQDPDNQSPNNLRGKFKTDDKGEYQLYCLKPTAYQLPTDGPAGVFLRLVDRSPWRPAHIHLMISHDDYKPVVTQLYPREDPHLVDDSVFAVKEDLVVDFKPLSGDSKAELELDYPIKLAPKHGATRSIVR